MRPTQQIFTLGRIATSGLGLRLVALNAGKGRTNRRRKRSIAEVTMIWVGKSATTSPRIYRRGQDLVLLH